MFYLYIIESLKNGRYYIGSTNNLERRLCEHNLGKNCSTKNRGPWKIIYTEEFLTSKEAKYRELEIKNKKRKSYIDWLINNKNGHVV